MNWFKKKEKKLVNIGKVKVTIFSGMDTFERVVVGYDDSNFPKKVTGVASRHIENYWQSGLLFEVQPGLYYPTSNISKIEIGTEEEYYV